VGIRCSGFTCKYWTRSERSSEDRCSSFSGIFISCDQKSFYTINPRHLKTIHVDIQSHECPICHKKFKRLSGLKDHVEIIHAGVKKFECGYCQKRFGKRGELNLHERVVHEKIKEYMCEYCYKEFGTKTNLDVHVRTIHEEGPML